MSCRSDLTGLFAQVHEPAALVFNAGITVGAILSNEVVPHRIRRL